MAFEELAKNIIQSTLIGEQQLQPPSDLGLKEAGASLVSAIQPFAEAGIQRKLSTEFDVDPERLQLAVEAGGDFKILADKINTARKLRKTNPELFQKGVKEFNEDLKTFNKIVSSKTALRAQIGRGIKRRAIDARKAPGAKEPDDLKERKFLLKAIEATQDPLDDKFTSEENIAFKQAIVNFTQKGALPPDFRNAAAAGILIGNARTAFRNINVDTLGNAIKAKSRGIRQAFLKIRGGTGDLSDKTSEATALLSSLSRLVNPDLAFEELAQEINGNIIKEIFTDELPFGLLPQSSKTLFAKGFTAAVMARLNNLKGRIVLPGVGDDIKIISGKKRKSRENIQEHFKSVISDEIKTSKNLGIDLPTLKIFDVGTQAKLIKDIRTKLLGSPSLRNKTPNELINIARSGKGPGFKDLRNLGISDPSSNITLATSGRMLKKLLEAFVKKITPAIRVKQEEIKREEQRLSPSAISAKKTFRSLFGLE